jgi:hypothetical protein
VDQTPDTHDFGEGNGKWDPGERIILDEGKIVWKSNADMALLLSYATKLTERISVGGTFKLVRQEIMDNSSLGAGVDLGAIYSLDKSTSFGLVMSLWHRLCVWVASTQGKSDRWKVLAQWPVTWRSVLRTEAQRIFHLLMRSLSISRQE